MSRVPEMPSEVRAVFDATPTEARRRLMDIRQLIFEAAEESGAEPITETLKWGEPAYLSPAGTTVRIAYKERMGDHIGFFVICKTNLVDQYRARFPSEFRYEGDRGVLIPVIGDYPRDALFVMVQMALTYHRDKRSLN